MCAEDVLQILITIITSVFASSGLWAFIQSRRDFVHGAANYLGRTYIHHCNNSVWSAWDELIRRSDFDALEARVAALEGGTT